MLIKIVQKRWGCTFGDKNDMLKGKDRIWRNELQNPIIDRLYSTCSLELKIKNYGGKKRDEIYVSGSDT